VHVDLKPADFRDRVGVIGGALATRIAPWPGDVTDDRSRATICDVTCVQEVGAASA